MNITVYSKMGCSHCTKVKTVLELAHINFVVYTLDEDFSRQEFQQEFGCDATFPQVTAGASTIGGAVETVKYLQDNNLVTL